MITICMFGISYNKLKIKNKNKNKQKNPIINY